MKQGSLLDRFRIIFTIWLTSMANPFLGVRIPVELNEAIATRMALTGQSKSEIVIDALKQYLGMQPLQHRLENVEHRLKVLELALNADGETVSVEPPTSLKT